MCIRDRTEMNGTWYPGQTIRASLDENNFGPSWTHYRVFRGLFWVQNGSEVNDTWYPGQTIIASQNERNLNQVGSKMGHLCLIWP